MPALLFLEQILVQVENQLLRRLQKQDQSDHYKLALYRRTCFRFLNHDHDRLL